MQTVRMENQETGQAGDYHPAEVEHMKLHGFRVVEHVPEPVHNGQEYEPAKRRGRPPKGAL